MTIRGWHLDAESNIAGMRRLCGGFVPNNNANPAITYGNGFAVTYADVGIWLLTMEEGWADFFGASLTLQYAPADAPDFALALGAVAKATKTVSIVSRVAGVKTNISASGEARVVWFELRFGRNRIPTNRGMTS